MVKLTKEQVKYNKSTYQHKWYIQNRERLLTAAKQRHTKMDKKQHNRRCQLILLEERRAVLIAYGGKCVRCGESRFGCLELDHINDDGKLHRKQMKEDGFRNFTQWLYRKNYLNDPRLQILCANCHSLKHSPFSKEFTA